MISIFLLAAAPALGGAVAPQAEPRPERGAPEAARPGSLEERASRLLRRAREADAPPPEELARQLAALGGDVVTTLLETLATRRLPDLEGEPFQLLNPQQEELLLDALRACGPERAFAALERRLAAGDDADTRAAGLVLHGTLGDARSLPVLLALAAPREEAEPPGERDQRRLRECFETALCRLLQRDPHTLKALLRARPRLPEALLPSVALGVGRAGDPAGMELLAELVRGRPELLVAAMAQIPALGAPPTPQLGHELARELCLRLDPAEPTLCQTLALALGYLEDGASVPHLVELLGAEHAGIRKNALDALRRLSGLSFPEGSSLWRTWSQREAGWYVRSAPRLLREAGGRDLRIAEAAIKELSRHRLYRHEIAAELAAVLGQERAETRALVCRALAELGSPRAVPALTDALSDRSELVRLAAWSALKTITKRDLPAEPAAWLALVSAD